MEFSSVHLIILFFLLFLFVLFKLLLRKKIGKTARNDINNEANYVTEQDYTANYVIRKTLFSPAERSFFGILKQSLSEHYEIFGKVRIADVLLLKKGLDGISWRISLSKITSKHFDYVLCDKRTLQILAVIELDDKTHHQLKTIERDIFVQDICKNSGLPLIRFAVKSEYHIQSVRDKVINHLN